MGDSSQRRSVLVMIFPEFYNWSLFHVILMYFFPLLIDFSFPKGCGAFVCLIEVHGGHVLFFIATFRADVMTASKV